MPTPQWVNFQWKVFKCPIFQATPGHSLGLLLAWWVVPTRESGTPTCKACAPGLCVISPVQTLQIVLLRYFFSLKCLGLKQQPHTCKRPPTEPCPGRNIFKDSSRRLLLLFVVLGIYPAVLGANCWLSTQGALLVGLTGP